MPPADDEIETALRPRDGGVPTSTRTFVLDVVEGPDAGATFTVDGTQPSRVLVGQSPSCSFRLSDRQVSRRHVALDPADGRLRVSDLGSTNGTSVNGIAIADAFLVGGEVLRLGATTIRVDASAQTTVRISRATRFGRVVGSSVEMRRLYPLCERLAATEVPVVIEGETGTGKEVLAESIHEASARAGGPFVVFDCTAVPPNLIESELFGHERGAFTGAVGARKGVFEQAEGGTLLIDEIGDFDLSLQPKLLRAIERSEIRRVGGDRAIRVNVRVLAATRRDLDREVQDGRFRDDLFYRLVVARIELPPLRSRRGDIGVLAQHLWQQLGGNDEPIPHELVQRFERYAWPGNVRELSNTVARHLALGELIESAKEDAAPPRGAQADTIEAVLAQDLALPRARAQVVADFERRYIERVLARHGGSIPRAAEASGLARRYFNLMVARRKR